MIKFLLDSKILLQRYFLLDLSLFKLGNHKGEKKNVAERGGGGQKSAKKVSHII
jgi:hypothetical protein